MGGKKRKTRFVSPLGGTKLSPGQGKPTLLDDAVAAVILNALRAGAWRKVAARLAGISPGTLWEWMERGEAEPDSIFGRFRVEVIKAESEVEHDVGKVALDGALKDPKLALDYLRVRHRRRWDPKREPAVVTNVTQQTTVTVAEAAPDDGQLGSLIDILGGLGFPAMGGVAQARAASAAEEGPDVSEGAVHPGPLEAPS